MLVEERAVPGAEQPMLGFATLTHAPIDRHLVVTDMLTGEERMWLNLYHARVLEIVGPRLEGAGDEAALDWLKTACAPL